MTSQPIYWTASDDHSLSLEDAVGTAKHRDLDAEIDALWAAINQIEENMADTELEGYEPMSWDRLYAAVLKWHLRKGTIPQTLRSTTLQELTPLRHAQMVKFVEEFGELAAAVVRNDKPRVKDAIGDMLVVLTAIAEMSECTLKDCFAHAYDQIKDRTGTTKNGIFVKEHEQ